MSIPLFRRSGVILCLALLVATAAAIPGQNKPDQPFLYYPGTTEKGNWQWSLGFILISPPVELTEEVFVRAPAFDAHALYGISDNISLDGRALSVVVQHHFSLGGRWVFAIDRLSVFEVYYGRVNNWESSPAAINALGMSAILYF